MARHGTDYGEPEPTRTDARERRAHRLERPERLADRVRGRLKSELNERKNRVTERMDDVAETVRRMGEPLRVQQYGPLGQYVDTAAGHIERFAAELRQRDVDELAEELGDLARRRPAVFVGASLAAGIVAARFLKSSSGETRRPRRPVHVRQGDEARDVP